MDLSGLIFVALAVAWAAYLIPKALKHHEEVQRSRSVEKFSSRMRVLARREPVDARSARLVVTPGRSASKPLVHTKGATGPASTSPTSTSPAPGATSSRELPLAVRRAAAARAARRRRRVLGVILALNAAVVVTAATGSVDWWWVAAPAALLVAWLVACRLMVRRERGLGRPSLRRSRPAERALIPAHQPVSSPEQDDEVETSASLPAVEDEPAAVQQEAAAGDPGTDLRTDTGTVDLVAKDPSMWDMIPVTLPTYVGKPMAARRTVRTIDLDSTGVWTSGRTESDAALARVAEETDRATKAAEAAEVGTPQRATGT